MSVAEEDGWFFFVVCLFFFKQLLGGLSKFYFILTKYVFRALKTSNCSISGNLGF